MQPTPSQAKLKIFGVCLGLLLIYLVPFLTVNGANYLFLKIDEIKGESLDKEFKDWIDISHYQHGVTRTISVPGQDPNRPELSDFLVVKRSDIASPLLFQEAVVGKARNYELQVLRDGFNGRERFYRVRLYDAFVTSFSMVASDEQATDSVGIAFTKMELTYTEYKATTPYQNITAWYDVPSDTGDVETGSVNNNAPTISTITNTTTLEDTPLTVYFTVNDVETSPSSLSLSVISGNTTLVPTANVTFGGSGSNRSATIRPATNQVGSASLTIRVSDGSATADSTFTLSVTPINDAPTISTVPAQVTEVDTQISVPFQVNDVESGATNVTVTASSSDQTLVPNANIVINGTGASRTAGITPAAGQSGDTTITLTAFDGDLQQTASFLLSVNAHTPQSPTNILLSASSVPENSTNGFVIGSLSAIDPDSTSHTFVLLDTAGGRFKVQGNQLQVDNGTLLNFEADTIHSILVRATDPDGLDYSKTLDVTVINVNEAPAFIVSDNSIIETIAGYDTPITQLQLADPDSNDGLLSLTLAVVNGTVLVHSNFTGTITSNGTAQVVLSGTLTNLNTLLASSNGVIYRATTNLSGTDLLSATLDDNGNTGIGSAQSVYTTLGIHFFRTQYDKWLEVNFTPAELTNATLKTTLWGPHADSDGDGLDNIEEYAIGTPPRSALHAKPGAIFVEKNNLRYLSLQLNRRKDPDLNLEVAVSGELDQIWSTDPGDLETFEPQTVNSEFESVRFDDKTASTDTSRRFMRLRWSLNNVQ